MDTVVVDVEATCWETGTRVERQEIIEIGAVRLDGETFVPSTPFSTFVRPVAEPVLSPFCRALTSIRQEDVDAAPDFKAALALFLAWIGPGPVTISSWGAYDLRQFEADCRRHGLRLPEPFSRHRNLKQDFAAWRGIRPCGMAQALRILGLPLGGTRHRAGDDARNIARIAREMVRPPGLGRVLVPSAPRVFPPPREEAAGLPGSGVEGGALARVRALREAHEKRCWRKRFGRDAPETVRSLEEGAQAKEQKREARKQRKAARRAAAAGGPVPPESPAARPTGGPDPSLRVRLLAMAEEDARVRGELAKSGELYGGYAPRMEQVHLLTAAELEKAVARGGWPGKSRVGPDGAEAAWRIAMHAISRPDLLRRWLPLLERAAAAGDAEPAHAAFLEDRIAFFERRPQRYGTQRDWNERGEMALWPVEDAGSVDLLRREVGLPPLVENPAALPGVEPPPEDPRGRLEKMEEWSRTAGWTGAGRPLAAPRAMGSWAGA